MKSLHEIEKEIKLIIDLNEQERLGRIEQKKAVVDRRKKRVAFLKLCGEYLSSNPTKEFLSKEKDRIEGRISAIEMSYNVDALDPSIKIKKTRKGFTSKNELEIQKDYKKLMGVPDLKEQLKSIVFLLN